MLPGAGMVPISIACQPALYVLKQPLNLEFIELVLGLN